MNSRISRNGSRQFIPPLHAPDPAAASIESDSIKADRSGSGKIGTAAETRIPEVRIPASKSQTIRALLIAACASGVSVIRNPLDSQDTRSCLRACRILGAEITEQEQCWIVSGIGLRDGRSHAENSTAADIPTIDVGNSGTTLYLGMGIAAAMSRPFRFTGDAQIQKRPVSRLADALQDLGASCTFQKGKTPPFIIQGPLKGGRTVIECPTSQYLSSLLLAAPLAAPGRTPKEKPASTILEIPLLHERPYAEMTLQWLNEQQITYSREEFSRFVIPAGQQYKPFSRTMTGDFSSASFFFCAAAVSGSALSVRGLDPEDPQGDKAVLDLLEQMGCRISWDIDEQLVTVSGPGRGKLKPLHADLNSIPDALPVLAVTACFADGTSILSNVPQARIKETDRIAVMKQELEKIGGVIEELEDGLVIHGNGILEGGEVLGHDDHRVIMALAVAGMGSRAGVTVAGYEAAAVTFPQFFTILEELYQYEQLT